METMEPLSEFLHKLGASNILAIGVAIILIWLLASGIRKGMKRRGKDDHSD